MPLFCALPWTLTPASAKVRTLNLPEGHVLGYLPVAPCPGVQQSKGFSVCQYLNINRSHPILSHPRTHRHTTPEVQHILTLTGLVSSRCHQGQPEHSHWRCWNQPAPQGEREIGNCWQRFSYLLSSCPWLVLHDRNYRHPNDFLTPGTGKSSSSPGMKKGRKVKQRHRRTKQSRSQSWLVQNWTPGPFRTTLSSTSSS